VSVITDERSAVQRGSSSTHASPAETGALDALIAEITRRRDEFDRLTYVPRDVIAMMKRVGIFRSSTPTMFGGEPMPPADFLRILERIAIADGSAAWVAAFGSAARRAASSTRPPRPRGKRCCAATRSRPRRPT
jgi:indole-3-acetate monooxygenase